MLSEIYFMRFSIIFRSVVNFTLQKNSTLDFTSRKRDKKFNSRFYINFQEKTFAFDIKFSRRKFLISRSMK